MALLDVLPYLVSVEKPVVLPFIPTVHSTCAMAWYRRALVTALAFLVVAVLPFSAAAQPRYDTLRVIAFGAHPDDCELDAGGVAAKWAQRGAEVKFVSTTNGDIGHFKMAGGPLARRREQEVQKCADIFGVETEVLDIHDGELMPTLENRKTFVRLIREWNADIVLSHRPYDYHPDHRYTGELAHDAAVMVVAKNFMPLTEALDQNPIFLHMEDGFEKPYPFQPDIVVGFDQVAEKKWQCVHSMPSQFGDAGSWQAQTNPKVPDDPEARQQFLVNTVKEESAGVADEFRDRLVELYGEERAQEIEYAEAFELGQYGRQVSIERLKELFPTGPGN
jgi:LmbE family N-acetylglucosaminyl deacetylase